MARSLLFFRKIPFKMVTFEAIFALFCFSSITFSFSTQFTWNIVCMYTCRATIHWQAHFLHKIIFWVILTTLWLMIANSKAPNSLGTNSQGSICSIVRSRISVDAIYVWSTWNLHITRIPIMARTLLIFVKIAFKMAALAAILYWNCYLNFFLNYIF